MSTHSRKLEPPFCNRILEDTKASTDPNEVQDMVNNDAVAPIKKDELGSLYATVLRHHQDQPSKTTIGDPIFAKSYSYASVQKVLETIQTRENGPLFAVMDCRMLLGEELSIELSVFATSL